MFLTAIIACSITSCPTSGFDEVRDPRVRQDLEAKWMKNKSIKLTAYYPDRKTGEEVTRIMKLKGIRDSDVSDIFYFSLDDGDHTICIETDEDPTNLISIPPGSELSVRPQKSRWIEQVGFPEKGCGQNRSAAEIARHDVFKFSGNARATWSGHSARKPKRLWCH